MAAVHYAPAAMHYLRGIDALLSAVSVHFFSGIFTILWTILSADEGHFLSAIGGQNPSAQATEEKSSPYFNEDHYNAEIEDTLRIFNVRIEEYV